MAITSYGYDGSMSEAAWAVVAPMLGTAPRVGGADDFEVTIDTGTTRGVLVAAGSAIGHGVVDVSDAAFGLAATVVASGTRYDTVCIRRDWSGAGGATSVVIVAGGTSETPVVTYSDPGVQCDYPIALLKVTSSSTQIQEVTDLRKWGGGGVLAVPGTAALPDASEVSDGTTAWLESSATGFMPWVAKGGEWLDLGNPDWQTLTLASNRSKYTTTPVYRRIGGTVHIQGDVTRTDTGHFLGTTEYVVCTLPSFYRPSRTVHFPLAAPIGGGDVWRGYITTDGTYTIIGSGDVPWVSMAVVYSI